VAAREAELLHYIQSLEGQLQMVGRARPSTLRTIKDMVEERQLVAQKLHDTEWKLVAAERQLRERASQKPNNEAPNTVSLTEATRAPSLSLASSLPPISDKGEARPPKPPAAGESMGYYAGEKITVHEDVDLRGWIGSQEEAGEPKEDGAAAASTGLEEALQREVVRGASLEAEERKEAERQTEWKRMVLEGEYASEDAQFEDLLGLEKIISESNTARHARQQKFQQYREQLEDALEQQEREEALLRGRPQANAGSRAFELAGSRTLQLGDKITALESVRARRIWTKHKTEASKRQERAARVRDIGLGLRSDAGKGLGSRAARGDGHVLPGFEPKLPPKHVKRVAAVAFEGSDVDEAVPARRSPSPARERLDLRLDLDAEASSELTKLSLVTPLVPMSIPQTGSGTARGEDVPAHMRFMDVRGADGGVSNRFLAKFINENRQPLEKDMLQLVQRSPLDEIRAGIRLAVGPAPQKSSIVQSLETKLNELKYVREVRDRLFDERELEGDLSVAGMLDVLSTAPLPAERMAQLIQAAATRDEHQLASTKWRLREQQPPSRSRRSKSSRGGRLKVASRGQSISRLQRSHRASTVAAYVRQRRSDSLASYTDMPVVSDPLGSAILRPKPPRVRATFANRRSLPSTGNMR
jgi:hypothetical protein